MVPPIPRRQQALAGVVLLAAATVLASTAGLPPAVQSPASFADTVAQLSEPGGYFDTNNLISNEKSYLHVVPALREAGLGGGVYVGVGPDQNFSYIAHTRPSRAFIIDIRRDNLLLHLLFKALFQLSSSRAEYLGLLFGRPIEGPAEKWTREDVERIASYLEGVTPAPAAVTSIRAKVDATIKRYGVPLSEGDLATIDRFHRTFIERGLALQFESAGRPPRRHYPTYRELLLETDASGRRWSYLASEADFQFVRSLQERDRVIPVVGDLAGERALRAVARLVRTRGERLSAFYTSNVEYYLAYGGGLERFVANLREFPRSEKAVIIRSVFPNRFGWTPSTPGYYSASLVQRVDDLVEGMAKGRIRGYEDLLNGHAAKR